MKFLLLLVPFFFSAGLRAEVGDDWRYADMIQLIEARSRGGRPFTDPQEFLEALPTGLRRNFTFMYKTGSKFQDADLLHPRAIVFNRHLVFTFNGHPDQAGFKAIEVLEFDEVDRRIGMREIEFTNQGTTYSTSTPRKCMQCHGSDPRPIWPQYPGWEGAYGSQDDRLLGSELGHYEKFLASVREGANPRYASLLFSNTSDVAPYRPSTGTSSEAHRINLIFTKLLTRFNALRLDRLIQESPYYEFYKHFVPITALRYQCRGSEELMGRLEEQLDDVLRERGIRLSGPKKVHSKLFSVLGVPLSRFAMPPNSPDYFFTDGTAEQVALVGEAALSRLLKSDPGIGNFSFTSLFHEDRYDVAPFYQGIDQMMPILKEVGLIDCSGLIKRALDSLENGTLPTLVPSSDSFENRLRDAEVRRANEAIPLSCVFCHSPSNSVVDDAPRISFDNEAKLTNELREDGGRLLRAILDRSAPAAAQRVMMPPPSVSEFARLSPGEWEAFGSYLNGLIERFISCATLGDEEGTTRHYLQ